MQSSVIQTILIEGLKQDQKQSAVLAAELVQALDSVIKTLQDMHADTKAVLNHCRNVFAAEAITDQ